MSQAAAVRPSAPAAHVAAVEPGANDAAGPSLAPESTALDRDPEPTPLSAGLAREAVQLIAQMLPGVRHALIASGTSLLAAWPLRAAPPQTLIELARGCGAAGRPQTNVDGDARDGRLSLACPVYRERVQLGVVAVELAPLTEPQRPIALQMLQWAATWLVLASRGSGAPGGGELAARLVTLALGQPSLEHAVMLLASELAQRFGADRASLGIEARGGMQVAALSDTARFDPRTKLVQALARAMDEAASADTTLRFPAPSRGDGGPPPDLTAHESLSEEHGDTAVLTTLLRHRGRPFAAITLERVGGAAFDPDTVQRCETVAALLGPALGLVRTEEQGPLAAMMGALSRKVGPRRRLLGALALAAAALTITFATAEHRVAASASVEGRVQRAVVAPYDGYIQSADHRAGDVVEEGAVLATLQARELTLERRRRASQREELSKQYRRALTGLDRAEAKILSAQIAQADAQLELIDGQLARSRLLAPFAGVIVAGDLSRSLEAPVERGQVLFEIAPRDGYRVGLAIDERDVAHVAPGQRGSLRLTALPDRTLPVEIEAVTPVASVRAGRNVFRAEARLLDPPGELRPGMDGIAKIGVAERSLIWVYGHRLVDWLRLWLWSWWP